MAQGINGKFPVTLKIVFELRYQHGFTYLDRCGRTINTIQDYYPDWITPANQPTPQSGTLVNIDTGAKLNFSSLKLDLSIDRPSKGGDLDDAKAKAFAEHAGQLTEIIVDQLGLTDFDRIACRVWYLFDADTLTEANEWLAKLKLFSASSALARGFEGSLESSSGAFVIAGEDRKFRVNFETVERVIELDLGDTVVNVPPRLLSTTKRRGERSPREQANIDNLRRGALARKHPQCAAMIDVDAYSEFPETVKSEEFVTSSLDLSIKGLHAAAAATAEAT